jgi:hypothetical protein
VFAVGFLLVPSQGFERLWGSVFADLCMVLWVFGFQWFSGFVACIGLLGFCCWLMGAL